MEMQRDVVCGVDAERGVDEDIGMWNNVIKKGVRDEGKKGETRYIGHE